MDLTVIFLSAMAGLITVLAGFTATLLARKQAKDREEQNRLRAELLGAYSNETISRRAKAVEEISKRLPKQVDLSSLEHKVTEISNKLFSPEMRLSVLMQENQREIDVGEQLIENYHEQALRQARVQFWFSIVAATAGFLLIISLFLLDTNLSNVEALARVLPGAVIEAVSGLFFGQANKTRNRATDLYDRLRSDKKESRALEIASSINDMKIRSLVKAKIALHFAGLENSALDEEERGGPIHDEEPGSDVQQ